MRVLSPKGKFVNPVEISGLACICWAWVTWQHTCSTTGFRCLFLRLLADFWSLFCDERIAAAHASYLLNCGGNPFCVPWFQEVVLLKLLAKFCPRTNCATSHSSSGLSLYCGMTSSSWVTDRHRLPGCTVWLSTCPPRADGVPVAAQRLCPRGCQEGILHRETSIQGRKLYCSCCYLNYLPHHSREICPAFALLLPSAVSGMQNSPED